MAGISASLQEGFSKHGQVDGDHLLWVVVTLPERCSDLLLVHQTRQGRLEVRQMRSSSSDRDGLTKITDLKL